MSIRSSHHGERRAHDGYYEALWPRSPRQVQLKPLAKRLDTLEGKTVAQLWDYVFRGDEVFALLEEGLEEALSRTSAG